MPAPGARNRVLYGGSAALRFPLSSSASMGVPREPVITAMIDVFLRSTLAAAGLSANFSAAVGWLLARMTLTAMLSVTFVNAGTGTTSTSG